MSQNTSEKTALPRLFPSWQKNQYSGNSSPRRHKTHRYGQFRHHGYSCPALRRLLCQCGNAENRLLLSACQSRLLCLRYTKNELRQSFSFANLHKVYCIILMEESPAGLHEDIFICLDIFRSIVHTITKKSIPLEAWLTFPSATDIHSITSLGRLFPCSCPSIRKLLTSHKIQRS